MKEYPAAPFNVEIAITGRCNLHCKHCLTKAARNIKSADELTKKELFRLFDEFKADKIFALTISGGEPFLRPDILEILDKIKHYPFNLNILTNGILINKKVVAVLKRLRYLRNIQVSLDGSNPEIHDWQRGKGNFQKALKGIRALGDNNIRYSLKAIINRHNFLDIENMLKLAKSFGLNAMAFGDVLECGEVCTYRNEICLTPEIYAAIIIKLKALKKRYPDFVFSGTLADLLGFIEAFKRHGPGKGKRGRFGKCGAGWSNIAIRPDGWVIPCPTLWPYKLGNIRKKGLLDIWNNSSGLKKIRDLCYVSLRQFARCRECQFITYCNGGCRAAGYYANQRNLKGLDTVKCDIYSTKVLEYILNRI